MSPQDHNKTLVILNGAIGMFFTLGVLASPWIISQNLRHREKIPLAILILGIVIVMASLFWATAITMYRRKRVGRRLALISAVAVLSGLSESIPGGSCIVKLPSGCMGLPSMGGRTSILDSPISA